MKQSRYSTQGMSLIEVLFASAILAIVLVAVGSAFNHAAGLNALAKNKVDAANDAKKIMEEARRLADTVGLTGTGSVTDGNYWQNLGNTGWLQTEAFSNLPGKIMSVSFPDGTSGDPLHILVQVSWKEKTATKLYDIHGLLTKRSSS